MKKNIFYLCFAAILLASCSSAYRSSQTPDDVYYSPGQQRMSAGSEDDEYLSYSNSSDDNYLRMKASDHYRWDNLDDFDYWNDSRYYYTNYYNPWSSYFFLGFYNVYNPYTSFWYNPWNSWYYPTYTVVYYKNPVAYYGTRTANSYHLSTYNNRTYNNRNYNMPLQSGNRGNAYNNSNLNIRRNNDFNINQNRNYNSNPTRTFNNNSSSNFNAGSRNNMSSGGGGGSMSRPTHH